MEQKYSKEAGSQDLASLLAQRRGYSAACALKASSAEGAAAGRIAPCCAASSRDLRGMPDVSNSFSAQQKSPRKAGFLLAQRRGFEPPDESPPSHDFQSCSLNHSDISARNKNYSTTNPPKKQLLFMRFWDFSSLSRKNFSLPGCVLFRIVKSEALDFISNQLEILEKKLKYFSHGYCRMEKSVL